jgi:hypothetical protein
MNHIVVKISPKRWIVAERYISPITCEFRVCTRPFDRARDAHHVRHELDNLDYEAYSRLTQSSLLESV